MGKRSNRWPYIRKQAWNRDRRGRAPCHICGEPIDYSIPASSAPLSWEPDHIIPWSKAPELELESTARKRKQRWQRWSKVAHLVEGTDGTQRKYKGLEALEISS